MPNAVHTVLELERQLPSPGLVAKFREIVDHIPFKSGAIEDGAVLYLSPKGWESIFEKHGNLIFVSDWLLEVFEALLYFRNYFLDACKDYYKLIFAENRHGRMCLFLINQQMLEIQVNQQMWKLNQKTLYLLWIRSPA